MKKWVHYGIITSASLILGSTIGLGGFYVLKAIQEKEKVTGIKYNIIVPFHNATPIDIEEVNIVVKGKPEKKDIFFLGKDGLHELSLLIRDHLNYGPEINGLKKIVIGDENIITKEANGLYFAATHEIFINTKNYIEKGFDVSKTPTDKDEQKLRARLLFGIIYHEYGHYLADTYLNSVSLDDPTSSSLIANHSTIYDVTTRNVENWDFDFVKNFKEILHYTTNNLVNTVPYYKGYSQEFIVSGSKNTPYTSIGRAFSAGALFDAVNNHRKLDLSKLNDKKYVFSGNAPAYVLSDKSIVKSKQVSYLYSLAELFTRKYQQLMMNPLPTKSKNWGLNQQSSSQNWGWLFKSGERSGQATNLIEDAMYYQKNLGSTNSRIERFMEDAPFDLLRDTIKVNTAGKLYDLMDRHMGHKDKKDISVMWVENNSEINLMNDKLVINSSAHTNPKHIRFSGFLKNDKTYNAIATKENGKYTVVAKLAFGNYNYKRKLSLVDTIGVPLDKNLKNVWYVTKALDDKKFINVDTVSNKEMFFVMTDANGNVINDKTHIPRSITSTRTGSDGIVSTYRHADRNSSHENYRTINSQGTNSHVIIKDIWWK